MYLQSANLRLCYLSKFPLPITGVSLWEVSWPEAFRDVPEADIGALRFFEQEVELLGVLLHLGHLVCGQLHQAIDLLLEALHALNKSWQVKTCIPILHSKSQIIFTLEFVKFEKHLYSKFGFKPYQFIQGCHAIVLRGHKNIVFDIPLISIEARVWRCRCVFRTEWLCRRCRSTRRRSCPFGRGSLRTSGCSWSTIPFW